MSKVVRLNDKALVDIDIIRNFLHENLNIDKDILSDSIVINAALRAYIECRMNDLYFKIHENYDNLPFE